MRDRDVVLDGRSHALQLPSWLESRSREHPMTPGRTDIVRQQVAVHLGLRTPHSDEDSGHSIRTPTELVAWDRTLDLVLAVVADSTRPAVAPASLPSSSRPRSPRHRHLFRAGDPSFDFGGASTLGLAAKSYEGPEPTEGPTPVAETGFKHLRADNGLALDMLHPAVGPEHHVLPHLDAHATDRAAGSSAAAAVILASAAPRAPRQSHARPRPRRTACRRRRTRREPGRRP